MIVPRNDMINLTAPFGWNRITQIIVGAFINCKCGAHVLTNAMVKAKAIDDRENRFELYSYMMCPSCNKDIRYIYKQKNTDCTYIGVTKFLTK